MSKMQDHPALKNPSVVRTSLTLKYEGAAEFADALIAFETSVKNDYPNKERRISKEAVEESEINETLLPDDQPHFRFRSDDKQMEIRIGPKYFRFIYSRPYTGWKVLKNHLYEIIALADLAFVFTAFTSMSLDFDNEIDQPSLHSDLSKVFELWVLPNRLPFEGKLRPIGNRHTSLYPYKSGSVLITLDFPNRRSNSERLYVLLSINFTAHDGLPEKNVALLYDWVEGAHDDIYQIFVKAIRPATLRRMM